MAEPLPCPFCGKPGERSHFDVARAFVRCPDGCTDDIWLSLEKWNRRVPDPPPVPGEPQDCPRCGSPPTECFDDDEPVPVYWVECSGANRPDDTLRCIYGPQETSRDKAVASWNALSRAPDPRLAVLFRLADDWEQPSPGPKTTLRQCAQELREALSACGVEVKRG